MTADIDPAFADRCAATAIGLRELAALGARSDADEAAVGRAAYLTADLLADPEALLAVALVIEQQRARHEQQRARHEQQRARHESRLAETRRLRDKLHDIYATLVIIPSEEHADQERRAAQVVAEIQAVWAEPADDSKAVPR